MYYYLLLPSRHVIKVLVGLNAPWWYSGSPNKTTTNGKPTLFKCKIVHSGNSYGPHGRETLDIIAPCDHPSSEYYLEGWGIKAIGWVSVDRYLLYK